MPDASRNPLTLARFELKRFRGPLPRLALVFILLIPLLYGCIYLAGNWDPYGRLENVPVAVVNHDVPTVVNDSPVQAGQDFVDSLHRSGTFDFIDTDAADAEEGLEQGRYYLAITVPQSFSKDLVSGSGEDPRRAQIMLRRNDANGFVIGTITNSAQNSIARAIDETAVQSYFEAVFANLATIRSSIQQAADGAAQLDDGLGTAHSGSSGLRAGTGRAVEGVDTLAAGATQLSGGAAQARNGAADLAEGLATLDDSAGQLADGARQVADGTQQLSDTVEPVLTVAAERLPEAQQRITSAVDTAAALSQAAAGRTGEVADNAASARDGIAQLIAEHPELADDPLVARLRSDVDGLAAATDEIAQHADVISADLAAADRALRDAGDLGAKAGAALTKVAALNSGARQVADGAAALHHGTGQARAGGATLGAGVSELADGAAELSSGTAELASGLHELWVGSAALDDGVAQLSSGAHELATRLGEGASRIPALTPDEQAEAVHVLSAPVDVSMEVDNPAHVYGRGLAPMFFSIALWVLGISAFFLVRPITGRMLASRGSDLRIALTAWAPLGAISVAAGWLMLATAWLGLGLDPVHPWLMILLVTAVALAFSSVAHLMRTWLGLVATAAMLVLLIIQLTAAGGTYPPELLPPLFAALSHFMPMTYTIDAFRIAISGGLMSKFARDVALLLTLFVSCMALLVLVVHRRRSFTMSDLHPPLS